MHEDEMVDTLEPGDPLQRQLARYARVRLEPDPAARRRMRATVMEAAWRQRLEAPAAVVATPVVKSVSTGLRPAHVPFAGWSTRRLGSTFAAAVLAGLVVAGTVFASSRAGGPLYETRLGLESAFLPADPAARVQAELALAQARLAEASQAAAVGDEGALEAALGAYGQVVESIGGAEGGPADQALAAVQVHLDVLLELQGRLPAAAGPAIERAIERSGGAIDKLENANAGPANGGNGRNGGNPDPGTAPATQKPERTLAPVATPPMRPSASPAREPAKSPRPVTSPKPVTSGEPPAEGANSLGD